MLCLNAKLQDLDVSVSLSFERDDAGLVWFQGSWNWTLMVSQISCNCNLRIDLMAALVDIPHDESRWLLKWAAAGSSDPNTTRSKARRHDSFEEIPHFVWSFRCMRHGQSFLWGSDLRCAVILQGFGRSVNMVL